MNNKYLLGVDFGGGASKATLLSSEGNIIATASNEYPTYYPYNGWVEQNPVDLYTTFVGNVRMILEKSGVDPEDIVALGISAASQTGVYLTEDDVVVRNSIYWTDKRSAEYAEYLNSTAGDKIYAMCHNTPTTARTLTHIMWLREHEPENYRRIKKIMFIKDYVRYCLTGDFVTDYIDAMGSLMMDVKNNCWSKWLCDFAGVDIATLPKILNPTDIVSPLSEQACKETGLSQRTKVIVGSTDTVMEVYANGAITPGQMTVKLATAGRICPITEKNLENPLLVNYKHVVPGLWYPGTGTKSSAASYRWYRDVLAGEEKAKAIKDEMDPYVIMDRSADKIAPGSDNLFFHPYLQGELTPYFDVNLRASFVGACSYHTKGHFNRAVLEGVAFSLKDCYNVIISMDLKITEASIIGGGSKSPLWRQMVSDMLGIKLIKTENNDSSLGSAMLAGVASRMFASFDESVQKCVRIQEIIKPDFDNYKIYNKQFVTYKKIHDALAPIYAQL